METKHTKGEWKKRGNIIFIDDTYRSVATIHVVKNYKDITFEPIIDSEAEANAKLIASAPDLLEALIELYDSLPDGYESECLPKVRKAIKKATE